MTKLYADVVMCNELGLHARAAAMIVKIAEDASDHVWLIKDGMRVDAASVVDILTLAGAKDSNIRVEVEQPADSKYLAKIVKLIEDGFGE